MNNRKKTLFFIANDSRGITLVALVVTIVVLLILAGITITMLFGENGIIKKAQDAKNATERDQQETEQGMQDLADQMGTILGETTLGGNTSEIPDVLERYILGEDKSGILATNIFNVNTLKFINNDIIPDASTSVIFLDVTNDSEHIYLTFKYNNVTYIGVVDITTYQTQEIRKYEEKIYEGTIEIKDGTTEVTNLTELINPVNQYRVNLTVNGEKVDLLSVTVNIRLYLSSGYYR